MKARKQALAVVAGPYRFYQTLWLYTQFTEYEWSILLLPYGNDDKIEMDIHSKCDKLGIFKKIYHSSMIGQNSNKCELVFIMLQMIIYYFVGKRKTLMKKILFSQTEEKVFDAYFIGCEYSLIEGSIIGLADEKDVYIFEEGLGDYLPRKKYPSLSLKEIACYIVSKMGYFSPYTYFELNNIVFCTKYASLPEALKDRKYKVIKKLFEGSDVSKKKYQHMLSRIYPFSKNIIRESDIILFTSPWDWDINKKNEYLVKMHTWMVENYKDKRICIKRHPRDVEKYTWNDLNCTFLDDSIPAEIIVESINKSQEVVMMGTSTILLSAFQKTDKIVVFKFENLHGEYERYINEKIKLLNLQNNIVLL